MNTVLSLERELYYYKSLLRIGTPVKTSATKYFLVLYIPVVYLVFPKCNQYLQGINN